MAGEQPDTIMPAQRPLAIAKGFEFAGWPCLLDIEFDAEGTAVAIRPRLLPPDWHDVHRAVVLLCQQWTLYLRSAGGAAALCSALSKAPPPERAVLETAASYERKHRAMIREAQQLLAGRLAREFAS